MGKNFHRVSGFLDHSIFFSLWKKKEETVLQDKEEVQEVTVSQAAAKEISISGFSFRQQRMIARSVIS